MPSASLAHQDVGRVGDVVQGSGLRFRLKEATAAAHRHLDARAAGLNLQKFDDYRWFLVGSAAALLPLESALREAGVAGEFRDWEARSRTASIDCDLARIGAAPPPLATVPRLSQPNVFGAMYVLEGSRLGARYLLRAVRASSDPRVTTATAYLAHGEGQQFWPSFVARLESLKLSAQDEAAVFDGAHLAFDVFASALARA